MRKIISLFIVFIFSFFCLNFFVDAKECKYNSIGLTVTDGNISSADWENFANPILENEIGVSLNNREGDITYRVTSAFSEMGKCMKHVFACVYVEVPSIGVVDSTWFKNNASGLGYRQLDFLFDQMDLTDSVFVNSNNGFINSQTSKIDKIDFRMSPFYSVLSQVASQVDLLGVSNVTNSFNLATSFVSGYIVCKEDVSDDPDAIDRGCSQLYSLTENYNKVIRDYKTCGDDHTCKVNKINILNEYDSMIKGTCSSILKTYSYDSKGKYCLQECFGIANKLNEMKRGTDLYEDFSTSSGTCSVSQKIWNFISNIFKWAKYFAPVLVIVLGIIDFIKAIASQSDDEMKKVQVRFIKRLIAAALLYIVPFLIEFALDAFNLVSDNPYCGLK